MHFLPDVYVPCEQCHGKRYNRETLEVRFKGKTIADVLEMPIAEALDFFEHIPKIRRRVQTLNDVGLGYMRLGQPATTLSGGEAQRVKLAAELAKVATGRTIYILDEPTTGLHFADIQRLLEVLDKLVDAGNSIVVIEHNLDVIKVSDYLIDLGPEGGDEGGSLIATGTPEQIAAVPESYTGQLPQATARCESGDRQAGGRQASPQAAGRGLILTAWIAPSSSPQAACGGRSGGGMSEVARPGTGRVCTTSWPADRPTHAGRCTERCSRGYATDASRSVRRCCSSQTSGSRCRRPHAYGSVAAASSTSA